MTWFSTLGPVQQAFLATLFTWAVTALGAAFVFPFKQISKKVLDAMMGFAAGVMIAASFWSLLRSGDRDGGRGVLQPWIPARSVFSREDSS
jgi:ZIP family zinc transporter